MKKRIYSSLALSIPCLGLLLWWLMVHWQSQAEVRLRLAIVGYDPRDLISGHYLQYHLDLGSLELCPAASVADTCLCLQEAGKVYKAESLVDCQARDVKSCPLMLRGRCTPTFRAGIERFYIPEADAPALSVLPANSELEVSLSPNGQARPIEIWIGPLRLHEYAEKKRLESSQ